MSLRNSLFAVLAVAAAAGCIRLGVWQLDRLSQRRAANARLQSVRDATPIDLNGPHQGVRAGRRVTVRGRFLTERTVVLRGRTYQGTPGVVLATPLALDGSDSIAMVVRGFVPAPDAATVDPTLFPPPDSVRIAGMAIAIIDSGSAVPATVGGRETWRKLVRTSLRERLGNAGLSIAIQVLPESTLTGFPLPLPLEELSDGPHLSYAIQWFSFAAIALIGSVVWLRRRR